jgi:hypothetical protein
MAQELDTSMLVFLDTETTGLDPDRHEIWDLAYILDGKEHEHHWEIDLTKADPMALKIGRYYERTADKEWLEDAWMSTTSAAKVIARDLLGRHIVGANPSFDDAFLKRFMLANGQAVSTWSYHLIDVTVLVAGFLRGKGEPVAPPWKSNELSQAIGVDPEQFDRHTAMGDARWVKAQYEAVMA